MSKSFNKFKRRVRAQSIAVSALLGVGVSAVGLAAVILAGKLGSNAVKPIFYLFAAVFAAALSLVLYFIFMPSDKRLAKRLDSLYGLDERVSTMVELRDDEGVFARLQREDADLRLGEKPIKSLKARQLVAGLLVFFISVGCIVGALIVPAKADGGESVIDEFDKQWIITAIGELITTVENAYINENLRGDALAELNSLLDFVESSDYLSEMKTKAISTVLGINSALVEANSAESLSVRKYSTSSIRLLPVRAARYSLPTLSQLSRAARALRLLILRVSDLILAQSLDSLRQTSRRHSSIPRLPKISNDSLWVL